MKNLIALIFIALMVASCGSTKEVVEEKTEIKESAEARPRTTDRKRRGPQITADQLIAELGLSEEQEGAFLELWNSTSDAMLTARDENRGDRDAMRASLKSIRDERNEGLSNILTEAQLKNYYKIMLANGKKKRGRNKRMGGK